MTDSIWQLAKLSCSSLHCCKDVHHQLRALLVVLKSVILIKSVILKLVSAKMSHIWPVDLLMGSFSMFNIHSTVNITSVMTYCSSWQYLMVFWLLKLIMFI